MDFQHAWGWEPCFSQQLDMDAHDMACCRVIQEHKSLFRLVAAGGEVWASPSGRLRYELAETVGKIVVGDWVLASLDPHSARGVIHGVLERKSRVSRIRRDSNRTGEAGDEEQILAANVDTAFVFASLQNEPNPRLLERYVALVRAGGVWPVILLTKSDLHPDPESLAAAVRKRLRDLDVLVLSTTRNEGLDALGEWLTPGRTSVLLGPSGVGKSTLVNRLAGFDIQETGPVRFGDGKGRHTTTGRCLFRLPGGALMIDTPGLRALAPDLPGEGLSLAFEDIAHLAEACRFRDCRHDHESGCAVIKAVEKGELDENRYRNYLRIQDESSRREQALDPNARKERQKNLSKLVAEVKKSPKNRFGR